MAMFAQWRDEDAARALPGRGPARPPPRRRLARAPGVPASLVDPGGPARSARPRRGVGPGRARRRRDGGPDAHAARCPASCTGASRWSGSSATTRASRSRSPAFRPPRTISTFSVWRTVREMEEMVHGRSAVAEPERHAAAMVERRRRDFHHEFATYRFRPLSEHGTWEGPDRHRAARRAVSQGPVSPAGLSAAGWPDLEVLLTARERRPEAAVSQGSFRRRKRSSLTAQPGVGRPF